MKRNRTAPIHFSPRDAIGTTSGTPTGTRAAGTSAPTTPRATSANARHIRTRTPRPHTHAMRAPMVGRDVLGAPRPRDDIGDAHMYAGRRGRRPLPRSAPRPHTHIARRTRTPCAHLVGRDVLGAPLPTERHRERHGRAGRRGRRPLPRTAPHPHTHIARRTRTPRPHTHAMRAPGPARRPRRAVVHGTTSRTPTGTRAAGDVGPYHAPRHVRTRTPRAAHARHARTW